MSTQFVRCACVYLLSTSVIFVSQSVPAQSLSAAKAAADSGDWTTAAAQADGVVQSGPAHERPEAAAVLMRALGTSGRHSDLEEAYPNAAEAADGTQFAGWVALERAKSTQNNAKDTTSALQQYNSILNAYADDAFTASGAMKERGTLQAGPLGLPETALASFNQVYAQWPESPFVDDAMIAKARLAVPLRNPALIDEADAVMIAINAPAAARQKIQVARGEYMNKVKKSRHEAIAAFQAVLDNFPSESNSQAANLARVRLADRVPGADFGKAIELYQQVIDAPPGKASKNLRDWARLHKGIYQYQLQDMTSAQQTFSTLMAQEPTGKTAAEAQKYLTGIQNPESVETVLIAYDRGIRYRQLRVGFDETFIEMQNVIYKVENSTAVADYLANMQEDREERAQMRYRVCFAKFFSGRGKEAFDLAGNILETEQPEGVTKWECLYMQAFLTGRIGNWSEAAQMWREIVDTNPAIDFMPKVYLEYVRALNMSGDILGSALMLEELAILYGETLEGEQAVHFRDVLLEHNPDIREAFEQQQPLVALRCEEKRKSAVASAQPQSAKHSKVGGAE